METEETSSNKTERPHAHFEAPHEVIVDPTLSKEQKIEALDSLEQDARQLATASGEGMSDGEATGLQEVLHAKDVLELPPIAIAYEVVLQDLHLRLVDSEAGDTKKMAQDAIAALIAIKGADQPSA